MYTVLIAWPCSFWLYMLWMRPLFALPLVWRLRATRNTHCVLYSFQSLIFSISYVHGCPVSLICVPFIMLISWVWFVWCFFHICFSLFLWFGLLFLKLLVFGLSAIETCHHDPRLVLIVSNVLVLFQNEPSTIEIFFFKFSGSISTTHAPYNTRAV